MKGKRHTERQTVFALQQAESGTSVAEICRKVGWRSGRSTAGRGGTRDWGYRRSGGCGRWKMGTESRGS